MLALARALAVSPKLIIADEMSLGPGPDRHGVRLPGAGGGAPVGHHDCAHRAVRPPGAGHVGRLRDPDARAGGLVRPASGAGQEVIDRYLGDAEPAAPAPAGGSVA